MKTDSVVNLLSIANNDLQAFEDKYKKQQQNVDHLESKALDKQVYNPKPAKYSDGLIITENLTNQKKYLTI